MTVFVYSAVPPKASRTLERHGLLSASKLVQNPKALRLARPQKSSRKDFIEKVISTLASGHPQPVLGPSVFFTKPDADKITSRHFIKKHKLLLVRVNLTELVSDYPDTIIWGAELIPIPKEWLDEYTSDDEFDAAVKREYGFDHWDDFAEARSQQIFIKDVEAYAALGPKRLWQFYDIADAGTYYASNVPHAFIITPMGYIPYEYLKAKAI